MSFLIFLLAPVAEVKLVFFRPWPRCGSKRQCFFFSLQPFLSEVSLISAGEELDGFGVKGGRGFLTELSRRSQVEEVYDLAKVEWAGRLPRGQCWFILYRIDGSCRLPFASTLIAFLMNYSQLLCSRSRYSIWAFIDSLRVLQKIQIRLDSSRAPSSSNS